MTSPPEAATGEAEPTPGEAIATRFVEARRLLNAGERAFSPRGRNRLEYVLETRVDAAIGQLAVEQLILLLIGDRAEPPEGSGTAEVRESAKLWMSACGDRKLHEKALSAYVRGQDDELSALLVGKQITARARHREDLKDSSLSYVFGSMTFRSDADVAMGIFHSVNVQTGEIILRPTELHPNPDNKNWLVRVVDLDATQLVDLQIRQPTPVST